MEPDDWRNDPAVMEAWWTTLARTVAVDLPREQLAWSAGFFDGEGNVGFCERRTPSGTAQRAITVQVTQVVRAPLDRLAEAVGAGSVRGPYLTRNPKAQPYYVFAVNGFESVQHVACQLWPWLGDVKREQFQAALIAFREFQPDVARCPHGGVRQSCAPCRSEWATRGWRGRRSYTDDQAQQIRERYAAGGITQRALAVEYGIGVMTVHDIVNPRRHDRKKIAEPL